MKYKIKGSCLFRIYSLMVAVLLVCAGLASAQMPAYDRLTPVTDNIDAPMSVALDDSGNIYVAESTRNRVQIYSQSGTLINEIVGLHKPISVTLDGSQRIYIGNKENGSVAVYGSDLSFLFNLGAGAGEFLQPTDIAVDTSGLIYVVDTQSDTVKIYNSDGSYHGFFGYSGSGNGEFHKPTSIEISSGEIFVLDHQLNTDRYGNSKDGARVQVFNLNNAYIRGFSHYGNMIGQMFRPQHLKVGTQGRIYVSDTFHNVVLVYDPTGTYLGAVYDDVNPLRTPLGMALGSANKLYVASLTSRHVEVFGLDSYTHMAVSPLSLNYTDQLCAAPALQSIDIANNGNAILNWTATTSDSWITLSATSGSVSVSGSLALDVGVDLTGIVAGSYSGSVLISADSGDAETVNISLTASPVSFAADAGSSYAGVEGQLITLDGSASQGCIVSYDWDIGSDGTYEYTSSSPTMSHIFNADGVYNITLRATDNTGSLRYAATTANISDSSPLANFTGTPVTGSAPSNVQFSNSSTGHDQPLTYRWDFDCNGSVDSSSASPSHTYTAGTYSVCLTVRDSDGSEDTLTKTNLITMNSGGCQNAPVRIGAADYSTLQDAYNNAVDGDIIKSQAISFTGDLNSDRNITVSVVGGYSCDYSTNNSGTTIISGSVLAGNGVLIFDKINLQ